MHIKWCAYAWSSVIEIDLWCLLVKCFFSNRDIKTFDAVHSRASKVLIRNQCLFMGTSQGQRAMLGGPEFVFWEILANGAGQKKIKNWNQTP